MEMKEIEISLAVYKALVQRQTSFDETPDSVLRRVLGITDQPATIVISQTELQEGLEISAVHKEADVTAVVTKKGILYDGKLYKTPSGAAKAVTGKPINGWQFWFFMDPKTGQMTPLVALKNNTQTK